MSVRQMLPEQSMARRLLPAYVLWLAPAVAAVAFDWSAWLTLACLIPGIVWYTAGEGARAYKDLRRAKPGAPLGYYAPALSVLSLAVVAVLFASRFAGLIIVGCFAYVDLVSIWRRAGGGRPAGVRR